jgi:hypothetical protein
LDGAQRLLGGSLGSIIASDGNVELGGGGGPSTGKDKDRH